MSTSEGMSGHDRLAGIGERVNGIRPDVTLRAKRLAGSGSGNTVDLNDSSASSHLLHEREFILDIPRGQSPEVSAFEREQTFEGLVLALDPERRWFVARLVDATAGHADEEAEFAFREVVEDDRHLVMPGALFTWHIGLQWRHRQMQRVSDIRFRRLTAFSSASLKKAASIGSALSDRLRIQNDRADAFGTGAN